MAWIVHNYLPHLGIAVLGSVWYAAYFFGHNITWKSDAKEGNEKIMQHQAANFQLLTDKFDLMDVKMDLMDRKWDLAIKDTKFEIKMDSENQLINFKNEMIEEMKKH